jgi:pimeloyl-ACP methyl ester carboxylesterase
MMQDGSNANFTSIHRRALLAATMLALAACASASVEAPHADFTSDRIRVGARGRGADVIMVHGLTSSSEIWDTTAAALEGRYRVHLVQINGFAGHAAQGNLTGPVSAPVADEIARYIRETGLRRPAIIGHSMGGTIGLMLAARHPAQVGKLMVVDMVPFMGAFFGGPAATAATLAPIADQLRDRAAAAPQGELSAQTEATLNAMVRTEAARPRIFEHARTSDNRVSANAFHELIVTDLRPELRNIRQPLTVLYVVPPNAPLPADQYDSFVIAAYANAPQARIVKINDSYHFIMIDQFDRFMSEVNTFLAG